MPLQVQAPIQHNNGTDLRGSDDNIKRYIDK